MIVTLFAALLAAFAPVHGSLTVGTIGAVVSPSDTHSGGPTGATLPIGMPTPSDTHSGGPTG
ncbi:MAG: hypothetical protein QOI11_41 [Candidatus Eremiobacteraeota bacterium]|jgi:hypothetical protein|nr:hypothetical protein [Candidatus Eremiobacteraeota bacterium]